MTRTKKPKLMFSPYTHRVYIVTTYENCGGHNFIATTKFDITDEFRRICKLNPPLPKTAKRKIKEENKMTPEEKKCSSVEDWDEYKEWKKRQALFVSKVAVMFGTDKELKEAHASQKSDLLAKVLEMTLRHISHKCYCWRIRECASVINVEIQDLDKKRISEELK